MGKKILILFTSILFSLNANAQCDGGLIETFGPRTVCIGTQIRLNNIVLPSNVSSNATYQWFMNGSPIYGETEAMQLVFAAGIGSSSTFQRQVKDLSTSCISYSNSITITYIDIVSVTVDASIFGDDTICKGSNASVITSTVANPGGNNLKYQWKVNEGYNGYFIDINGATNKTFTPSDLASEKKYILQYYFSDIACSNTANFTNVVTKTVMDCGIFSSNIRGASSVVPGQTTTHSVPGTVGMQYFWQVTGGTITAGQGTNSIDVTWDGARSANARTAISDYLISVTETDAAPNSKTTTQAITMTTTGINKAFASAGISVFPNPVTHGGGQFVIEMSAANTDVDYNIYSVAGFPVQSGSFTSVASGNTVDTELPAGMYQLVLNYNGVFTGTRLVVAE